MGKKSIHNKKRNTALLYEFLARHAASCLLENKKKEAEKAMKIMSKYFNKNTLISEELGLFKVILQTQVRSESSASSLVNEVCESAKRIDSRLLNSEKSQLIKEINHTFNLGDDFYGYKVKDYPVYASLQMLFNNKRKGGKLLEGVSRVRLEDGISSFLLEDKSKQKQKTLNESSKPEYNEMLFSIMSKKFKEKYGQQLTPVQCKLISSYTLASLDENKTLLEERVYKEVERIKKNLAFVRNKELRGDKDIMNKVNESLKKLSTIPTKNISEEEFIKLLKYSELADEVSS